MIIIEERKEIAYRLFCPSACLNSIRRVSIEVLENVVISPFLPCSNNFRNINELEWELCVSEFSGGLNIIGVVIVKMDQYLFEWSWWMINIILGASFP